MYKIDLTFIVVIFLTGFCSVNCDCEPGWYEYYGNCYYISATRLRYNDYERTCTARNATVYTWQSKADLDWIGPVLQKGPRIMYWTGLHLVNHHWTWSDLTPYNINYVKWLRNKEGNTHSGSTCTAMYSYRPYLTQIAQQGCTASWGSICVRPKDALDICDLANGWHYVGGQCLKFFDVPKNWFDARQTCQDHDGDLTQYKSYNQLLDLYDIVPCHTPDDVVWIGLSDTVQPRVWRWINNDTMRYSRWYYYGNQILKNGSTCAAADPTNGFSWRHYICETTHKFVCNRSIGVCPTGWLQSQDRCYQPNVVDSSKKSWFDAKTYCESMGTSGSLLIINSDTEQQFITKTLNDLHVNRAWLAFSDIQTSDLLTWTDGRVVVNSSSYQHWASSYPQTDQTRYDCGIISRTALDSRWSNGYCFNSEAFICEMKVTDKPFRKPQPPVNYHCDPDWILFNNHCYYFGPVRNQTTKNWNEAKAYCLATGGSLVVIGDPYEMSFVIANQKSVVMAWIGLSYNTATKQLTWVDGSVNGQNWVNETNFAPGGSADVGHGKACIQIDGGRQDYTGAWTNANCTISQGFICEKTAYPGNSTNVTTTQSPLSLSAECGAGWIFDNNENVCYQVVLNSPKTWTGARADCRQKGSDLLSISGRREQNFIQGILRTGVYASIQVNFWLGATDLSLEGGWAWTDGSPFRYLNWHSGEPNNRLTSSTAEDCGEIVPAWGYQWNDKKCSIEQLYICKKTANLTQMSTLAPPTEPPLTKSCIGEPMISGNYSLVDNNAFAASTSRDTTHLPYNSRWYPGSMGAWSARTADQNQWISASFFSTIVVTGFTTAGRTDNDEWVTSYKIQYQPDYYSEWTTYNYPPGKAKIFSGNNDSITPVTNMLVFPFEARAVRLIPVTWNTGISLRWEILGCLEEDCNPDYGVSGPLVVGPNALTASSASDKQHDPNSARLHRIIPNASPSCWRPASTDTAPWIQVDLGSIMVIRGITIHGDPNAQEWVTQFKLKYGLTSQATSYTYYQEPYNTVKTIKGNIDNVTPVTYFFKAHFQGQFVRVIPVGKHNQYAAMAFDILVCPKTCKGRALISGSNPIPDDQLNASTVLDDSHGSFRSRLNQQSSGGYGGAWIPRYQDTHQFLQVDLGYPISINGMSTQGSADSQDWIMMYQISYSDDAKTWNSYFETGNSPKIFYGNWDNHSVRKHYLAIPVLARYVRLWPKSWYHRIAVRWEVYGCPGPDSGRSIGCYADDSHDRDLPYEPFVDPRVDMWPPMCIHHCFNHGYLYAGLQNQNKCFCGNTYGRYGPATDCTMSCVPKTGFFCGGPSSNNVHSTGLTPQFKVCPPNWKAYLDQCYILLLDKRSWFDARAACQMVGGDLASPNSQHQQDFVYSLLQYGSGTDAWIGFNDIQDEALFQWTSGQQVKYANWNVNQPRQQPNTEEDCVVMTRNTGGWQDESCDSVHQYVCQMSKKPSILPSPTSGIAGCEKGWDGFRWSCYLYADAPRSWQNSKALCATFGGTQVRIEDRSEQAYLSSVLGSRSGQYWTDVTDQTKPGTYHYSDGSSYLFFTNWAANKPDASSQCVSLGSGNSSGLWYNRDCTSKLGTICEKMRLGHTSPPPVSTTAATAPCGQGLITSGEYCYQVNVKPVQRQLNWMEAQDDCSSKGASLATFHNGSDLDTVWRLGLVGNKVWFWIGLNGRSQQNGYSWPDGSSLNYLNWGLNQPDNYKGTENCVEMDPSTGRWNDADCYVRRNWICMIKRGSRFTAAPTITAPTIAANSDALCGVNSGFSYFNGACYKAYDWSGNQGKTWRQARTICQQTGGDLASISSVQEEQFIYQRLLTNITAYGVWIGLNELDTNKGYRWSDDSPVKFTAWDTKQPDNYKDAEDCVTLQIRHGKWNDEHCGSLNGYVCKKRVGTTPAPISPTDPFPGFCPIGYNLIHNKCYRVYSQALNWTAARAVCRGQGAGYDLASVQNDEENAFLITLLADMSVNPWLGMQKTWFGSFQWINQDDVTYTNFATGEPNGGDNQCVQMYGIPTKAGEWLDNGCWDKEGFVCQTKKQQSLITPEPTPNVCDVDQHYKQFRAGCYVFMNQPLPWANASAKCSQQGAALASINSPYEQAFVYVMIQQQSHVVPAIWIGLNDRQTPGTYQWSDSWPVMYTDWDQGQPLRMSGGGCVLYNNTGRWSHTGCAGSYPFICKISQTQPPLSPPPPDGTCDMGWNLYGRKCYYLQANQLRTVLDATLTCQQMGATLLSIHNKTVNDYLTQLMSVLAHRTGSFWTSLHKSLDSGFMWVDGSPLQFTNWRPGQPSTRGSGGNDENCVEVFLSDGKWNDEDCNSKRAFICEKLQASDPSINHIGTGAGGIIRSPTPIPHSIPSILPPQKVPTLSRTGSTGHPTPDLRTPTPFRTNQQGNPSGSQVSAVTNPLRSSTMSNHAGETTTNTSGNSTNKQLRQTGSNSSSESPGTIAAIVLGAVVAILLTVAIVMLWWRKPLITKLINKDGPNMRFGSMGAGFENQTYRSDSMRVKHDSETKHEMPLRSLSESST